MSVHFLLQLRAIDSRVFVATVIGLSALNFLLSFILEVSLLRNHPPPLTPVFARLCDALQHAASLLPPCHPPLACSSGELIELRRD